MKVNFKNCDFDHFEPHREIDYRGKKYRAIDVDVILDDGTAETHTIADIDLEYVLADVMDNSDSDEMIKREVEGIDDEISYYAEKFETIYYILEQIVYEEVSNGL